MTFYKLQPIFASTYGSSTYDSSTYGGCTMQGSTCVPNTTGGAGGTTTSGGGVLTNTGFDVALVGTLAAVVLLSAVLVRFVRRPAKPAANAATSDKQ